MRWRFPAFIAALLHQGGTRPMPIQNPLEVQPPQPYPTSPFAAVNRNSRPWESPLSQVLRRLYRRSVAGGGGIVSKILFLHERVLCICLLLSPLAKRMAFATAAQSRAGCRRNRPAFDLIEIDGDFCISRTYCLTGHGHGGQRPASGRGLRENASRNRNSGGQNRKHHENAHVRNPLVFTGSVGTIP